MKKPSICLIEPCHSHEEVLFPVIDYLRAEYDVHVLAPQSLLDVDLLNRTRHLYNALPFPWRQNASRLQRLLQMPRKYRFMRRLVASIDPEIVLFNSTHNTAERLMIATFFKGVRKAQIVHKFTHYLRPGMKWLYRCFDVSLVISEDVHKYITGLYSSYDSLAYFLPLSFEGFEDALSNGQKEQSGNGEVLQLGVIGSIESRRRNYEGLLRSLANWHARGKAPKFRIHLIGKAPTGYQDMIEQEGLCKWVKYYDRFVSFEEMFSILRRLDLVLFLIDRNVADCELYNRYTIPCTSIWVNSFHKACAASRDFRLDERLKDKCIFYEGSRVEQLFESIENGSVNRELLGEMESRYASDTSLSRDEQKQRLVRALKVEGET